MNQQYYSVQKTILNEASILIPIISKIKKYLFPAAKKEIEVLENKLSDINNKIKEVKLSSETSNQINDTLDNFERARNETQLQLGELERSLNIANMSIFGACIIGAVGISSLFYYRWKLKEAQLEKQELTSIQKQEAKKQFTQQFINQLDQTKLQVNKFSQNTKNKIHKNIDHAKQHILNKVNN